MNPAKLHRAKMHPPQLNPGRPLGRDGQRLSLDNDQLLAPGTVVRYIDELIARSSPDQWCMTTTTSTVNLRSS